jgi:hypothetical protein
MGIKARKESVDIHTFLFENVCEGLEKKGYRELGGGPGFRLFAGYDRDGSKNCEVKVFFKIGDMSHAIIVRYCYHVNETGLTPDEYNFDD